MRKLSWTVLRADAETDPGATPDGVENMARDDTLARSTGPDEGVLRFYRWRRPTLSFGRNEPATELYRPEAELRERGLDLVRRPTGGRAVLHYRELTYSVVIPIDVFTSLRAAYRAINAALVAGVRGVGVEATQAGEGEPPAALPLDAGPCFRAPAEGEVVVGGRKLVGSAQVRVGRFLLQHGSILLEDDQARIDALLRPGGAMAGSARDGDAARPATLADALGTPPPIGELIDALVAGFRQTIGGDWRTESGEGSFPDDLLTNWRRLHASREWLWRR